MASQNFTTSFTVEHSAAEVFKAITNVRGWWTGDIDGNADTPGAEFTYRYPDLHYSKQKVTELVPDQKLVWRVTDAHLTSAWGFFVNGSLRRLITTGEGPGTPPWEAGA
ncbi:SRPBCC family protein [Micromonospora sp. CPCC 206061]|uniref:SRPBCC family protein n=1 Tax=Micromonospora sp. CPCC 206061 TaxID=3122410 RepID=UPI002FF1EC22